MSRWRLAGDLTAHAVRDGVFSTALLALECAVVVWKTHAALAHPGHSSRGNSDHQSVIWDIFGDYGTRRNKAIFAKRQAAHDCGVSSYRCTFLDYGSLIFMLSADVTARIDHVCEHHRGPAEDIVLQLHSRVDRDIVLYLYIVSDAYAWANNHILSEVAILAQTSPA